MKQFTAGAMLLLGWTLLIARLDRPSLWVDEFLTLQMIAPNVFDTIATTTRDLHPPLYFIALQGWLAFAGQSDFTARWFSIACGIVSVALLTVLSRQLVGAKSAMLAVLLLSVNPAFIMFSRMARYYALLMMLGLLSTVVLLKAIQRGDWKTWLVYAATALAILSTFYPGGVLLVAHGVFFIARDVRRGLLRRWFSALAVAALTFAPWFVVVARNQVAGAAAGAGADLSRSALGWVLGVGAAFYTFSVGETLFPWNPFAWLALAAIAILFVRALSTRARAVWQCFGLALLSLAFMSAVTTFVSVNTPFLNVAVRSLFVLPYWILVLAMGLTRFVSARAQFALGGTVILVSGISLFNYHAAREFLNPIYFTPSRDAANLVLDQAIATDLVVSDYDSVFGHYFLPGGSPAQHLYSNQLDKIQSALPARVWLITIGRDRSQSSSTADQVRALLAVNYRLNRVEKMLPIDPTYKHFKDLILRRETYAQRLTIELYQR